ncbi:MAG TPA: hypothetical protein VJ696_07705 [Rhodanobacteraceae bacterium]|nr:hypothetical protein [Rhodanobacteraceae bacterium]
MNAEGTIRPPFYPASLIWLACAIFATLAAASAFLQGPTIQVDEGSYLLTAAAIAGKIANSGAFGYYSGYSVLLLPALWLCSTPASAYHAALLINAALVATTPFALFRLTTRLAPDVDVRWHVAAALATTCHASLLLLSQHTMSESAIVPLYAWLCATCATAFFDRSMRAAICGGCLAGVLFLIHPRGGAIALPILGVLSVPALRHVHWRKPLAGLWASACLVAALHVPIEHLDAAKAALHGGYDSDAVFGRLASLSTWYWIGINFLGSLTETLTASFGLFAVGLKAIADGLRSPRSNGKGAIVLAALALGACMGFFMSAVFFVPPTRADQIAYGRYALPTALPIVAFGLVQFSQIARMRFRMGLFGLAVTAACIAAMALVFTRIPISMTTGWVSVNAPALYLAQRFLPMAHAWSSIAVCFVAAAATLYICLRFSGRFAVVAFVCMNLAVAVYGWSKVTWPLSRLYAADRTVIETARNFERVSGVPLCVRLSRRIVGWHAVDFRWRLFDRVTETEPRAEKPCAVGTIDYIDKHDPADFPTRLVAIERSPPTMKDLIGLFVAPSPALDRWKSVSPPVPFQSLLPVSEDEQRARITLREPSVTPVHLHVGEVVKISAHVTNTSARTVWPAIQYGPYPISFGARTRPAGSSTTIGEYRLGFEAYVPPEGSADASITIGPFPEPGTYHVDVGMLQERVAWFPGGTGFDVEVGAR